MTDILPSLLAAPPLNLERAIHHMLDLELNALHVDILDHHFAPNFGFSPKTCSAIKQAFPQVSLDVHLMTDPTPLSLIHQFIDSGVQSITIHPKTLSEKTLGQLPSMTDIMFRLGVLPNESLDELKPFFSITNHLLMLAVNPGFSNQAMIPDVLKKASDAQALSPNIMFDGGVCLENIQDVLATKPSSVVIGGGLFSQPPENQRKLIELIRDLPD